MSTIQNMNPIIKESRLSAQNVEKYYPQMKASKDTQKECMNRSCPALSVRSVERIYLEIHYEDTCEMFTMKRKPNNKYNNNCGKNQTTT